MRRVFNEDQALAIADSENSSEQGTVVLMPQDIERWVRTEPGTDKHGSLAGTVVGHYLVKELIGRGSFGEVYRAVDPRLGRDVAIKVAAPSIADDPQLRELFWNEARIQARIEHSNIVPIYDVLDESGRLAMVMRLIHGQDLDKRLKQMVRPFTPLETLHLMRYVASALGSAHDRGVIHQDMKPGNIRLTPSGEPVVLDFGVARITGQAAANQLAKSGTPGYMSPEQIRGEAIDARSDIYSLAMTLYKTLTGHHPFEDASDVSQLLVWQVERAPPPPSQFNPNLPPSLVQTILQGLAKDPRDRFRACADFTAAISSSLGVVDVAATVNQDGRWDPRAAVNLVAQVLLPGCEPMQAQVVDLSISGAALRLSRPLAPETRAGLVIRIPLRNSEHVVRCSMRVLRTTALPHTADVRAGVVFEALGNFDRAVLGDLVRAILVYHSSK